MKIHCNLSQMRPRFYLWKTLVCDLKGHKIRPLELDGFYRNEFGWAPFTVNRGEACRRCYLGLPDTIDMPINRLEDIDTDDVALTNISLMFGEY